MPILSLMSDFEMNATLCSAFCFDLAPQTIKLTHLGLYLFSVLLIHRFGGFFFFFLLDSMQLIVLIYYITCSLCFVMFLTVTLHFTWATMVC